MSKKLRTPLIAPRKQGSTFYTFSSAMEDIGLNVNDSNKKIKISHYVLLELPKIAYTHQESNEIFLEKRYDYDGNVGDKLIAEHIQDYVLNFETVIRNLSQYNYTSAKTISERIFWKWLFKHIQNKKLKYDPEINRYYEDASTSIVKGLGLISAGSHRTDESGIYNETFVQIPSSFGQMRVFYKVDIDENYNYGSYFTDSSNHIENIPNDEFDDNGVALATGIYSMIDADELIYRDNGVYGKYNITNRKSSDAEESTNWDAISIDFDINTYREKYNNATLTFDDLAIGHFNGDNEVGDYTFNAILVYYSIYDSSEAKCLATNAYGIYIIDNAISESYSSDGDTYEKYYFPSLRKLKSSEHRDGTSYSFRLNIKPTATYTNEISLNDNSTPSYEMSTDFTDMLKNLSTAVTTLQSNSKTLYSMARENERINTMAMMMMEELNDKKSGSEQTDDETRIIVLEKNGVISKLTQNMLNKSNSIYVIRYDFDLQQESITIPEKCILLFEGGSLQNGTLIGSNTQIVASKSFIFRLITIHGTWNVPEITSEWFYDVTSNNGIKNVFALQNDDVFNRIVIEPGGYLVSASKEKESVINLTSNTDLILNGTIRLQPNGFQSCYIVYVYNKHHINISGSGTIVGDKDTHTGTEGQWGHGIYVIGQFITIKDIFVKDCWGDCICIGKSTTQEFDIKQIIVDNCKLDNGRRQGLSITHGENIIIRNCYITNIGGHNPQAGIDIEPNSENYAYNVYIENCRIDDCKIGIVIYGRSHYSKSCISINNCYIKCQYRAFAVNGISTVVNITNCEVYTRFHAVDANTIDGAQDNVILFENNIIKQQFEEGDDPSSDARGCVIYAIKGDYCFKHNSIIGSYPIFRFGSGRKYIEDNDIECSTLFYNYSVNHVIISKNRINGNVTLPGIYTKLENNTINGFLKSTEVDSEAGSIIRGNYISHPEENNEPVTFSRRVMLEDNTLINVSIKMSEGSICNNRFTYNSHFSQVGVLLNVADTEFTNNTVIYNGNNPEDKNIYIVRTSKSIINNSITSGSRIQYVFYPVKNCIISGNEINLPNGHATNRLVPSGDFTIIPKVRTSGTTADLPTLASGDRYYVGCRFFATDLNKALSWNGHCWVDAMGTMITCEVVYNLTNITSSSTKQPLFGEQYTILLTPASGYSLPATITVNMGSSTLTAGTDYTYNNEDMTLSVLGTGGTGGVTDTLTITATAVET